MERTDQFNMRVSVALKKRMQSKVDELKKIHSKTTMSSWVTELIEKDLKILDNNVQTD